MDTKAAKYLVPFSQALAPCNFYVVFRGRQPGIKYKWTECVSSIAGFEGAAFKGADTMLEAELMYSAFLVDGTRR